MGDTTVVVERLDSGAVWRLQFGGARGNVLDAPLTQALTGSVREASRAAGVKALLLEGRGPDFSFGASVQEHLPGEVAGMLGRFHGLVLALLDSGLPLLAVVRGRCLGGGLELASVCHRVFASRDAILGQPEIALGVFAPVASIVLPERIGRPRAEDLLLSGRSVGAEEALALGLVDETGDDPAAAALAWARRHLLPRSAASLRFAVRAARVGLRRRLARELPELERLYLDELMACADPEEGLRAFLEKRAARFRDA